MLLQRLIFGGKSIQEDVMLQDYNILMSSTIYYTWSFGKDHLDQEIQTS